MKIDLLDIIIAVAMLLAGWVASAIFFLFIMMIYRSWMEKPVLDTNNQYKRERQKIIEGNKRRVPYPMFIDDERQPAPSFPKNGVVIRSYEAFVNYVTDYGLPTFISFDHDLGNGGTGYDVAKYIVDRDLTFGDLPTGFTFFVHSQNPVGKRNIEEFLNSYLEYRNGQK